MDGWIHSFHTPMMIVDRIPTGWWIVVGHDYFNIRSIGGRVTYTPAIEHDYEERERESQIHTHTHKLGMHGFCASSQPTMMCTCPRVALVAENVAYLAIGWLFITWFETNES
jgi:hypothetical protein